MIIYKFYLADRIYFLLKKFYRRNLLSVIVLLLTGSSIKLKVLYKYSVFIHYYQLDETLCLIDELFKSNKYKIKLPFNDPVIVDIGANIGLATLYFKNLYPKSRIYAYEPNPKIYNILQKNAQLNELSHVYIFRKAIVSNKCRSQKKIFYIVNNSTLSSFIYHVDFEQFGYKKKQIITTKFNKIFDNILYADLLKIDIEGSESSLVSDILNNSYRIGFIIIEFHDFLNENFIKHYKSLKKEYKLIPSLDAEYYQNTTNFLRNYFTYPKESRTLVLYGISKKNQYRYLDR